MRGDSNPWLNPHKQSTQVNLEEFRWPRTLMASLSEAHSCFNVAFPQTRCCNVLKSPRAADSGEALIPASTSVNSQLLVLFCVDASLSQVYNPGSRATLLQSSENRNSKSQSEVVPRMPLLSNHTPSKPMTSSYLSTQILLHLVLNAPRIILFIRAMTNEANNHMELILCFNNHYYCRAKRLLNNDQ